MPHKVKLSVIGSLGQTTSKD